MATAPKDGTEIWAYTTEGYQRVVRWQEDRGPSSDDPGHDAGWASDCGGTYPGCFYHEPQPPHDPPLRWRPLPASPDLEDEDFDEARAGAVAERSAARSEHDIDVLIGRLCDASADCVSGPIAGSITASQRHRTAKAELRAAFAARSEHQSAGRDSVCERCDGEGEVTGYDPAGFPGMYTCRTCNGTGKSRSLKQEGGR